MRNALVVVLGHSRLLWVRFYPRQDLRTLLLGLETCFTERGGVPKELLFDQMKAVITRDDRLTGGGIVENLELSRFARHRCLRSSSRRACTPRVRARRLKCPCWIARWRRRSPPSLTVAA